MPQPFYNTGSEYWCSKLIVDLEYDSDPCNEQPIKTMKKCRECCFFEKQDYSIVIQREDQKHLI
jgi:hypothetical protein